MISVPKQLRGMLADRPAAVAALTKIFLDEIERLLCAAVGVTRDAATPASARPLPALLPKHNVSSWVCRSTDQARSHERSALTEAVKATLATFC